MNYHELTSYSLLTVMALFSSSQLSSTDSGFIDYNRYKIDGVSLVRRCFEPSLVDHLKAAWVAIRTDLNDGSMERNARFIWGNLREPLASLYAHHNLVKAAQVALNTINIALYMNRLLLKDAEWNDAVSIHQDMPYFSGGQQKVSAFIPLTPIQARNGNGGLIFVNGSHNFGNLQRGTIRREIFPPMDEFAPDLEVGDVIFMDFLTWHYSEKANIPTDRAVLQLAYQPASDGSYGSARLGVPKPTLVSGEWMTSYFAAWGESTIPDA